MKKRILFLFIMATAGLTGAFAYNPPVGGENLYTLTSPDLISGGASATGGAFLNVVPPSICFNPAITGTEQRSVVDLSGTFLFNADKCNLSDDEDSAFDFGFQLGTIIPTKYAVFTVTGQGLFADFNTLNLRDSFVFHAGAAKEIIPETFFVGMNIYTGFYTGNGSDFTAGVDFGTLYLFENDIAFLKKPRLGFALLNVGKPLSGYKTYGYNAEAEADGAGNVTLKKTDTSYPGIITPRASFAATLFDTTNIDGAFSADVSFPSFQNCVVDTSFALTFLNKITLSTAYQLNIREFMEDVNYAVAPSIGINFHFEFNSSRLNVEDWAQSEIVPSVAWQQLNTDIHAVSLGAKVNLGMADKSAPEIILWDEE